MFSNKPHLMRGLLSNSTSPCHRIAGPRRRDYTEMDLMIKAVSRNSLFSFPFYFLSLGPLLFFLLVVWCLWSCIKGGLGFIQLPLCFLQQMMELRGERVHNVRCLPIYVPTRLPFSLFEIWLSPAASKWSCARSPDNFAFSTHTQTTRHSLIPYPEIESLPY